MAMLIIILNNIPTELHRSPDTYYGNVDDGACLVRSGGDVVNSYVDDSFGKIRSPGTSNIIGTYIVNSDGYMSSSSYDIWNVSYGRGHVTLSVYWIYIWCKLC